MRELTQVPPLEEMPELYFMRLEPYYEKVHARQPLNKTELDDIAKIRDNLKGTYRPEVLQDSKIMTYIHHILGRNITVTREVEEERLEAELGTLHVKLTDKGLAPDEREGIERQRKSICQALYPEYHPPTP